MFPVAIPFIVALATLSPARNDTDASTVATEPWSVDRFTVAPPAGAGALNVTSKTTVLPGATSTCAGRTIPPSDVVVTVADCTVPVKPPEAVPLIVVVPAVVPAVTTPASRPIVTLEPARMMAVFVVAVPTAVLEEASVIVMSAVAVVGLFDASRRTAVMVLVDAPSAEIVDGLEFRKT